MAPTAAALPAEEIPPRAPLGALALPTMASRCLDVPVLLRCRNVNDEVLQGAAPAAQRSVSDLGWNSP